MLTKNRLIQLFIMLSLLIGLFIWRTVEKTPMNNEHNANIEQALFNKETLCDFSSPCEFNSTAGIFSLSVEEGKIIPEEWFHLILQSDLDNWEVKSAKTIDKTMFMGKIPIIFSPTYKIGNKRQAEAKTMIGVCITDKMLWRFEILVELDGKPINLYYDFLISR